MRKDKIKTNFILQLFYQLIVLVLPLIISPFVTRRLGDTSLGIYSYVNSVGYYFVLFANMGITKYGQRVIAASRNDENTLRHTFWSLYATHLFFSVLSIVIYILFVFVIVDENVEIYWINLIYVASAAFDITWLFYGLENFKNVIAKNLFIRIVTFSFILAFIKEPDDLWIYVLIEAAALLLGNILLIPTAVKAIPYIKVNIKECIVHIKPLCILSISVVAIALYTIFDKTLLGILSTKENVAYYEYSNKIINIPKTIISVVGTVIFPRACLLANQGDRKGQRKYSDYAFYAVSFIAFASIFGLISISDAFVNLYYGESFSLCGIIIPYMTPLIVIVGIGEVIRSIYLIPMNRDSAYVLMTCVNAIINLIVSIPLISKIGVLGAVAGTTVAEISFLLLLLIYCRKYIDFFYLIKSILCFGTIGLVMYWILEIPFFNQGSAIVIIVEKLLIGGAIYFTLSLAVTSFCFKDVWSELLSSFKNLKNGRKIK